MISQELQAKLKTLPAAPGVYFHKNSAGDIIYVGKAAVLKNRVRQYFQNSHKDPKTAALVQEIAMTDWIVVDTEMDALFLESEMIKRYMPKWNILLRDDKTVSYVRISPDEVPYVSMTRTPMDDRATYVGPFYAKLPVEKALRILRKVFPYYTKPYDGKKSLDTDLHLTPGIEVGASTPAAYRLSLKKLVRYLEGDRKKLLKDLEKQMKQAAAAGNYEEAALARNQLFGLQELRKKIVFSDKEFLDISSDQALVQLQHLLGLEHPPRRIEGYDISHQSGTNAVASMVVFTNGVADRSAYRKFKIRQSNKQDDLASMREVIARRLKHPEWPYPDLIVLDGSLAQLRAVKDTITAAIDAANAKSVKTATNAKKSENPAKIPHIPLLGRDKSGDHGRNAAVKVATESGDIVPLKSDSHIAKLIARIDEESHRFAVTYHTLLKRKGLFK